MDRDRRKALIHKTIAAKVRLGISGHRFCLKPTRNMNRTILLPDSLDGTDSHDCFYRSLVDQMPDPVTVVDDAGTILFASPSSERLSGRPPQERLGRSIFKLVHPDDVDTVRKSFDAVIRSGEQSPSIEYRCRHRDADWRTLESVMRRCLDDTGAMAVLIQCRDATERKTREDRRMQAEKLEAVSLASGAIARDFSDLLSVLTRHVGVLERSRPAAVRADALAMRKAIDGAKVLVDQLLAFSQLDEVSEPASIDLNEVVEEMAEHFERLAGPGIDITYLLGATAAAISLSRSTLEQVLSMLVEHARDAMPSGGRLSILTRNTNIGLSSDLASANRIAEHLVLEIADTGIGMSAETKARIFEPSFTAEGIELGLHSVLTIVRRGGGSVAIDSGVNRGTTVRVLLPVSPKW